MSSASTRGVVDSIRARLLNRAHERGEEFQRVLVQYAYERFLYRMGTTDLRESYLVKGAMLFRLWDEQLPRATRDLDLLGLATADPEEVARDIRRICGVEAPEDGLQFDEQELVTELIREETAALGVRARWTAHLGTARIPLQVDVGYGDAAAPAGLPVEFPTFLELPAPDVLCYPPEFAIAEKLQAVIERGLVNSRLKDYFDIAHLVGGRPFDGGRLREAISKTFASRQTVLPQGVPEGLTEEYAAQTTGQAQWKALMRRIKGEARPLAEVVREVAAFVVPVLEAVRADEEFSLHWSPGGPWEEPSMPEKHDA